jgi:adenylosuccinate synthase
MTLQVIVGGQFGSEGKGAIAAHLARTQHDLLAVRVAGPNAGHTVIGRCPPGCPERQTADGIGAHHPDAHPWRLRQVPVAAVTNEEAILTLGPGSEIDPDVLLDEVTQLNAAGYRAGDRLWIDYTATVITAEDKLAESDEAGVGLPARIGSTGKGIGAARSARLMRTALLAEEIDDWPCNLANVAEFIRHRMVFGGNVQIEGTQGYGLGLHAGSYPHCTSSDCTAIDFMAMAGVSPWVVPSDQIEVWVVYRTYPIRVAGNSGPLRYETTWEAIGQPTEYTTVTRKPRRVGQWDAELARKALEANGHRAGPISRVFAALTMADYVVPGIAGCTALDQFPDPSVHDQFDQMVSRYSKDIGTLTRLIGTGPASVIDLHRAALGQRSHPMKKEFIA